MSISVYLFFSQANLVYALDGVIKLRQSVVQKKLQLQRQKLEMKLSFVLHSQVRTKLPLTNIGKTVTKTITTIKDMIFSPCIVQIKLLEAWGSIERQHSSAVSVSLDCLQSAVCRVPLIEGATVSPMANQKKSLRVFKI